MYNELRDWLVTVVPPKRLELVESAFEAMVCISDYNIDEVAINLANTIDQTETNVILNKLNSDLVRYPEELLANYGVFLDIEVIEQSHLPVLVDIMNTVRVLDVWDEPDELLHLIETINLSTEAFAEMVKVITDRDSNDVLEVLLRVEVSFIEAVKGELQRIKRVDDLLSDRTEESIVNYTVFELIKLLPGNNPLRDFVEVTGLSVMEWHELDQMKEHISKLEVGKEAVISWYTLAVMSGFHDMQKAITLISMELEIYKEDQLKYHMEFAKLFKAVIGNITHDKVSN